MSEKTIAIVGRPNVGKSSLFNAIAGKRIAIVHHESGVTRDRVASKVRRDGKRFQLVDTGGLGLFAGQKRGSGSWDEEIQEQVSVAVESADTIFFVCDTTDGLVALDADIASRLRASGKKIFLVPSKADNDALEEKARDEFKKLGFEEIHPVSSLHRRGISELMEEALADCPSENVENKEGLFKIAVAGRPNVGKSSLVNKLLGEKRVIVSDVAGTTRDSIDIEFELKHRNGSIQSALIDTAGLRKKSKVSGAIEKFSVMRAEESVKRADLVLFVVEASPGGLTAQDRHIGGVIEESGKPCVIVANKWDSCSGSKQKDVITEIRRTLPQMNYAPLIFTCALSGYNFKELLDEIALVRERMGNMVSTSVVNRVLADAQAKNMPPVIGNRPLKIYYGLMTKGVPPTFTLFVNDPELCAREYVRYLVNYFHSAFDFEGMPIVIKLKARPKKDVR